MIIIPLWTIVTTSYYQSLDDDKHLDVNAFSYPLLLSLHDLATEYTLFHAACTILSLIGTIPPIN